MTLNYAPLIIPLDGYISVHYSRYTGAIVIGNPSALLYTRRAELLLKLKRPVAAIKDCDAALKLNPDSGKNLRIVPVDLFSRNLGLSRDVTAAQI